MTASTHETLKNILCSEPWYYDSQNQNHITFKPDGTGELLCRVELSIFIAAHITWSASPSTDLSQTIDAESLKPDSKSFILNITLQNASLDKLWGTAVNVASPQSFLRPIAFQSRECRVRLDIGRSAGFVSGGDAKFANLGGTRYRARMVFDRSPYPDREEWLQPTGAPDSYRFWEWKEFVAWEVKNQDKQKDWKCVVM